MICLEGHQLILKIMIEGMIFHLVEEIIVNLIVTLILQQNVILTMTMVANPLKGLKGNNL